MTCKKVIRLALLLISCCIFLGPARARAESSCVKYASTGQYDDNSLKACTDEINSGSYTGDDLAVLYADRGIIHDGKKEYSLAISDITKAISLARQHI